MATRTENSNGAIKRKAPPATTIEAREDQMISLAEMQAEEMLLQKKAPTPIVVHYLRLGTSKNRLEMEKLRKENILLEAKAAAIESEARSEELYARAIAAMREYSGSVNP